LDTLRKTLAASTLTVGLALGAPVRAAPPPIAAPASQQTGEEGQAPSGLLSDLNRTNFLLGDLFGTRTDLARLGISLAIQETSEGLGNLTGGQRQGVDYDGLTQIVMQMDTQRAFGWHGGVFNVSALQVHGRNLSSDNLLTLQTASGIEADRGARLWELWYDQKLLPEDRLSIRIGQQSADQEFLVNANGNYFVNTMFGWPMVPSADLPGGGPAYPLSAPAVRFKYRPVNSMTLLLGVFSGSPAPTSVGDPQQADGRGLSFPLNRGVLVIAEAQFAYPAIGAMVYPGQGAPLGHTWRIGAWYDSESFDDQRFDTAGGSLASPTSTGLPRQHRGDWSVYASGDQMIWRKSNNPNRSVSLFARVMDTPQPDRNLIDFSLDGGVVYHDPIPNRPDDTVALGMGYAHVSGQAAGLDADTAALLAATDPTLYRGVRGGETFVELTYQYQVKPWWQLQPDLQVVFNPGGGIGDPDEPTARVKDEVVLGLRTNILF
jgi:porin